MMTWNMSERYLHWLGRVMKALDGVSVEREGLTQRTIHHLDDIAIKNSDGAVVGYLRWSSTGWRYDAVISNQ